MTQKVGHSVILTLLVFEGKVVTGQLGYPSLSGGIQIGRGEDVGEQIVVRPDNKLIPILPYGDRYSWNCSVTAHLRAKNSCLLE